MPNQPIHISSDNYCEVIRPRLSVDLVSTNDHSEMLSDVPHYEIKDLSVIFRIRLSEKKNSLESILIDNQMINVLGLTFDQLKNDSLNNAPKAFPIVIESIASILFDAYPDYIFGDDQGILYCASIASHIRGAGVLAYPNFIDEAESVIHGNFFILPSSIHEIILVKDTGDFDINNLLEMVTDINSSIVRPSERLSDNAYHYDIRTHTLESAV